MQPLPPTGRETGIDVGLKVFLVTAEGEVVENPRHYRRAEKALEKAQRRVSRRKKGSKRRRKAVQLAGQEAPEGEAATARLPPQDGARCCCGSTTRSISKTCGSPTWSGTPTWPRASVMPAGRSSGPSSKAKQHTLAVEWSRCPPAYTSQDCSGCGERVEKSLSVRTHVCTSCGLVLDRDENAARNIQWAGQALRGVVVLAGAVN